MRNLSLYIILIIALTSCNTEGKVDISDCKIITNVDSSFNIVLPYLTEIVEDSIWEKDFFIEVVNHSYNIKDKKNKWTREFESHYAGIKIMSYTEKNLVLYAYHSGILNGYTLFPKWWHDVYVLDRQNGNTIKLIEIKRGLTSATIYDHSLYMRFYDPDEIRVCPL